MTVTSDVPVSNMPIVAGAILLTIIVAALIGLVRSGRLNAANLGGNTEVAEVCKKYWGLPASFAIILGMLGLIYIGSWTTALWVFGIGVLIYGGYRWSTETPLPAFTVLLFAGLLLIFSQTPWGVRQVEMVGDWIGVRTEAEARRTPKIIDGYPTLAEGAIIEDLGPRQKRYYRFAGGDVTVHIPTGGWCLGYPLDSLKVVSESADHLTVVVAPLRDDVIAYLRIKSEGCKKPVEEKRA